MFSSRIEGDWWSFKVAVVNQFKTVGWAPVTTDVSAPGEDAVSNQLVPLTVSTRRCNNTGFIFYIRTDETQCIDEIDLGWSLCTDV